MDKILGVIGGGNLMSQETNDDTGTDRLFHRVTTAILVLFAVVVSASQFVGDPIHCWTPAHFAGGWDAYTDSYCWIKNTYYLPFEDNIPKAHEERHEIPYYQWVPMIFLFMALMFYSPVFLWRGLNNKSGIDIKSLIESAETFISTEKIMQRGSTLVKITKQMDRYLESQGTLSQRVTISVKNFVSGLLVCCGRNKGTYLVALYIITKILFIVVALSVLFLLNFFMGSNFHMYGIDVLRELIRGKDWTESPRFPRVTMCDFNVRRLGNVQRYTVQCVLPINLFNEKLFLFLWWWIVMLITLQLLDLIKWMVWSVSSQKDLDYIKHNLKSGGVQVEEINQEELKEFAWDYLKPDGVFLLRLVGGNTNALTVSDIIRSLWYNYAQRYTNNANNANNRS